MDQTFLQLLTDARRREIIRTKGRPKLPRAVVPRYPKLQEIKYQTRLLRLVARVATIATKWARDEYPDALARYQEDGSTLWTLDADAPSTILSLTRDLDAEQYSMFLDQPTETTTTAGSVNTWVAKRFALERQIALGMVYDPQEPWVQKAIGDWVETNKLLVKSLIGEHRSRMETMALDAVTNGKRPEQLLLDVMKANKMSYNKARLIARDQIGKLTAQLTEKRSLDMGLNTYTWRTALDERVRGNPAGRYPTARPSHWGAEGKIGVYGKPGIWIDPATGKEVPRGYGDPVEGPGTEIQCFLGEQKLLSHVPVQMLFRHRYSGKGTVLTTHTGEAFRCTPNHPVLRADGIMVPAHLLNKGDKIIQFRMEAGKTVALPMETHEHNQKGLRFEDLFELGRNFGALVPVGGMREDFHGDGSAENVDIVDLEGGLPNGVQLPSPDEGFVQLYLSDAFTRLSSVVCLGEGDSPLFRTGDASQGLMGSLSQLLPFVGRHAAHSEEIRLRSIAALDTMFLENARNGDSKYAEFLGQCQLAVPGFVPGTYDILLKIVALVPYLLFRDRAKSIPAEMVVQGGGRGADFLGQIAKELSGTGSIVELTDVFDCEISAHVYNLQNSDGRYCVEDSTGNTYIVSNCRCLAASRWEDLIRPIDQSLLEDPYVLAEMGKAPWPD